MRRTFPTRRFPIAVILLGGLGGLLTISLSAALALALYVAQDNTVQLLQLHAQSLVQIVEGAVKSRLQPAKSHAKGLADWLAERNLDLTDSALDAVSLSLVAEPSVRGTAIALTDGTVVRVGSNGEFFRSSTDQEPALDRLLRQMSVAEDTDFGEAVWSNEIHEALVITRHPIRLADGRFAGVVASAVTIQDLSAGMTSDRLGAATGFVVRGDGRVLAHPRLAIRPAGDAAAGSPLPTADEVGDPVLAMFLAGKHDLRWTLPNAPGIIGHQLTVEGRRHFLMTTTIPGAVGGTWTAGAYIPAEAAGGYLGRLTIAGAAGIVILLFALAVLWWVARTIRAPADALALASEQVAALEFDHDPVMPYTRVKELEEASEAFRRMIGALRWFETYVPKRLVARLMSDEGDGGMPTRRRAVTVLFTDIVGFSGLSEVDDAKAVAGLLNDHFTLLARCVDAEDGTIDKYIGDSLMAFWGAPSRQEDHAARACRATLAIADAIRAENRRRHADGLAPVRIRIGLFDGRVVAGNIGAPGRINYTLVGDAVNAANRLEQLGKEIDPSAEVVALAGSETIEAAGFPDSAILVGERTLRGRTEPVRVYRLV